MSHVFISYKKEDRRRVQWIVAGLVAEGLSVWWDVHIEGGAVWREEIRTKLDSAACVVVVWSKGSVGPAGHFVQDEAAYADRRGVYLPVAIDEVTPPLGFGQQQVIALQGWRGNRRDRRFAELRDAVAGMLATAETPPTVAPMQPRSPARRWRGYATAIAAAVVAVLALVAVAPQICSSASQRCAWSPFAAHVRPNSIAVLPFANLSGDPAQDYFSDGLSDELLSRLARIPQLQVSARTSSFKFKGAKDDSRSIGAKLGVNYILDGSVRRDGSAIRVTAQLVEARTGFERWSQTYDRDFKDIFTVQSDIADAVAQALRLKLGVIDEAALERSGASNPEAYDDYLKGRRLFSSGGGETSHRDALAKFDAAIAADPRYGAAYSMRARTLMFLANQSLPAKELRTTYDDALASARRAVELDPQSAEAQATLAEAFVYGTRDFAAAKLAYQNALANGGAGNAEVLLRYGQFECETGNLPAGLAALRRAVTLDPLNARGYKALGVGLLYARQYVASVAATRQALKLSPAINGARARIGDAMMLLGRPAEARSEYDLEPEGWQRLSGQAIVFRRLGDAAAANRALKELTGSDADTSAYQIAQIRAQWGDFDAAFAALDRAYEIGDAGLWALKVDPFMDPLRGDARFKTLLRRVGLE